MEDQREKREREEGFTNCESKEPDYKRLCNTKEDDIFKIPVKGKYSVKYGTHAVCSAEDYDTLSQYSWHWHLHGYPMTYLKTNKRLALMSRFILKAEKGVIVDHINRDRKDNRRNNLRFVTPSQNAQNRSKTDGCSSQYKGVSYAKNCKKFLARVKIKGVSHNIGYFDKEIEAAKFYDTYIVQNREQIELCQELNFPNDIDNYKQATIIKLKKRKSKSGFYNVVERGDKFEAICKYKKKQIYLGRYETAEASARVVDAYIVRNNLDRKLNFPGEYPNFNPKTERLHITEVELTKNVICEILRNVGEHTELIDVNPEKDVLLQIGGKNKDKYTIIERADYESMKYFSINLSKHGYVNLSKGNENHILSRFIFRDTITKDEVVDHIFSNKLDNRKRFLKLVSVSQNNNNKRKTSGASSKFYGVSIYKNNYAVQVSNKGKRFRKCVKDEFEAARLRDIFIIQNYPNDNYRMNFNDWDEKTINHWTNQLKEHITWKKPIVASK